MLLLDDAFDVAIAKAALILISSLGIMGYLIRVVAKIVFKSKGVSIPPTGDSKATT